MFETEKNTPCSVVQNTDEEPQQWVNRGRHHLAEGNLKEALAFCRRALAVRENFASAHRLMAEVLMPGADYIVLLSQFHEFLRPESYLEIGVAEGRTFALARSETHSIGIDPSPSIDRNIRSNAKVYATSSDEFFATYDLLKELGAPRLAMAFIDGLHLFEQALKDIINIERYADDETVIIIHDCLPIARLTAARERVTGFWCGDVWKTIRCLRRYRPDLSVSVVPARPSGLGIITNLNPQSTVLADRFDEILDRYKPLSLDYDYLDFDEQTLDKMIPNLVPNEWLRISKLLATGQSPTGDQL